MDFPHKSELVANKFNGNVNEIGKYIGVDSLEYMTIDEMKEAMVDHESEQFCAACFSGIYPTNVDINFKKEEYDHL